MNIKELKLKLEGVLRSLRKVLRNQATRKGIVLASIGGLIVIFTSAIMIYGFGLENRYLHTVSYVLRFPALYVNGEDLSYRVYMDEIYYLEGVQRYGVDVGALPSLQSREELRKVASESLMQFVLVEQWAEENNISVSEDEVDAAVEQIFASSEGQPQMLTLESLEQDYGIRRSAARGQIERQLLFSKALSAFESGNLENSRVEAEEILNGLREGVAPAEFLNQPNISAYGDVSESDRTLTSLALLDEEMRATIVQAAPGEVVPVAIETRGGYYVAARPAENADTQVHLLLVQPERLDQWLLKERGNARTFFLLPQLEKSEVSL